MRRSAALVLLLSVTCPLLASPASAAPGPVVRSYVGTTSAGGTITLFTAVRGDAVRFLALGLEDVATCADGTTIAFGHGVDHSPRGIRLRDGVLEVESRSFSDAFSVDATIGTRTASGTITHLFAALDADEEARLCTTGELSWTAGRERASAPVRGSAVLAVVDGTGRALARLDDGASGAAPAARERLRFYEGRTSSRHPLFVVTARTETAIELRELGLTWHLACDDGSSSIDLGVFISFFGEVIEAGGLGYDSVAPEIALHVNGTLDPHLGEGTTSISMPALTDDLEAQTCRSGGLTWRAWRVDAGAKRA